MKAEELLEDHKLKRIAFIFLYMAIFFSVSGGKRCILRLVEILGFSCYITINWKKRL
jgi:hypothetical protein